MATTWTAEDDRTLTVLHQANIAAEEISRIMRRTPGAVRTRMRKIGLTGNPANATTSRKMCPGCGDYFDSKAQTCSVKCGSALRGRRSQGRPNARGARSGKRADLDNLFVRSRWEANYARYLNHQVELGTVVRWEYEPTVFQFPIKRGNKSYTPDFKVWFGEETYEWHEVKGWMDNDSRIKLERFARHHPDESAVLKLIDRKVYVELEKQHSGLPGWES